MSSSTTVNPQLRALRWRLLGLTLGVIGCTLTAFGIVVYQTVAQSLEQKSERQLKNLADAAAHSLPEIALNPNTATAYTPKTIDNDGDLDIPWQDLRQDQQSIEWFDANRQLLARVGRSFSVMPLISQSEPIRNRHDEFNRNKHEIKKDYIDNQKIYTLTIPIFVRGETGKTKLQGYVRVSDSNEIVEEELTRLRSGLQWGGLLALILSGSGGWWLTQQSLQPIDRSIRQLKQFTADASHELRNPLTAIKASVEVMQSHQERFQDADRRKLEAISSAANQMSQLVDDLLWLARSDRAETPSSSQVIIPITELLEEVIDQYLPQAEQKQIDFKATELEEASVLGDPFQLKRLFSNLITNALHYTPAGGIVSLSASVEADEVSIQIIDTGIGIAPEHLPYVFDRFWRADAGRARQEGGSGLGLAIAQAIVQQHDGQITVHSKLGQGSCFRVVLPTV